MELQGRFFDGRTSQGQQATLRVDPDGSMTVSCLAVLETRFAELRLSDAMGRAPRQLHFPGGEVFETTSFAELEKLEQHFGNGSAFMAFVHRLEQRWLTVLMSVVFTVFSVIGFFQYGVPGISRWIAYQLPLSVDYHMGEGMQNMVDETPFSPSRLQPARVAAIEAGAQALFRAYPDYEFQLRFRHFSMGANAFAMPGGTIVVTDGLIRLAESDAEVLAVIAHEMGHVVGRHSLRQLIQKSFIYWMMMAMTGDLSSASDMVAAAPVTLATLGYSRDMELEADSFAISLLKAQHSDPVLLAHILERLEGDHDHSGSDWTGYLSTHPATDERIRRIFENQN